MTLSYRWSSLPTLTLTSWNIEEFRQGGSVCNLPKTFRDAIVVAHRFSIRYLWIDSLCIMQDSPEDWQVESSMMRHVYANSCCNIAATASLGPEGGLFRIRNPADIRPGLVNLKNQQSIEQMYFIHDQHYWTRQVSRSPLYQRGWVFQERLLAPRVLHFTEKQVFWECFEDQKCEAFPQGLPFQVRHAVKSLEPLVEFNPQDKGNPMHPSLLSLWLRIVSRYSDCVLTRPSDNLVALSGLARLFQEVTGDEYLAGLWRSHLLDALDWRVDMPGRKLTADYRAPSWSWASLDGHVSFYTQMSFGDSPLASIKRVKVTPLSDPTGQIVDGFLEIEGCLIKATYLGTNRRVFNWKLRIGEDGVRADVRKDIFDMNFKEGRIVYCLPLKTAASHLDDSKSAVNLKGLVLEQIEGHPYEYTRIGFFVVHEHDQIAKFGVSVDKENGALVHIRPDHLSVIKIS